MRAQLLFRHPEADANSNGVLSDEEFEAFKVQRQAERRQRILERYPEADLDEDGTLGDEEIQKFTESCPDRRKGKHIGPRGPWFEEGPEF